MAKKDKETTAITTTLATDKALGEIFVNSGFFSDAKDKDQAVVKILAGREAGLQPIESMTGIHIIKGKITFGSNMMASAVKKHPNYDYRVVKHTTKECEIDFLEVIDGKREKIGTSSFTYDEAKNIGLTSNQAWKNYPKAMLFARALSAGVRYYCPDVFGHSPAYVPEELGAEVNEDNEPINITPKVSTNQPKVVKQCVNCGGAIPNENESGICATCMTTGQDDVGNVSVTLAFDDDITAENESDEEEPDDDDDEGNNEDEAEATTTIIPASVIDGIKKPREAIQEIMGFAMKLEKGDKVRPVVIKHYKDWETGTPDIWNIPETKIIKMVEELTGIKMKKAEKTKKCGKCGKRITEPEAEEQQDDKGNPFCLKCWLKENQ